MSESGDNPRKGRRRLIIQAAIGMLLLTGFLLAGWYVRSERFNARLRARVIADLEQVTGGKVELKSLEWRLWRLEFEARDLTIHGLEARNEIPYMHADRLLVRARMLSLLRHQFGLSLLQVEHPTVHLIVYPDGTTNQPQPRGPRAGSTRTPVEELFELAIGRVDIKNGVLLVNDRSLPLDLAGQNVAFTLKYFRRARRYDAGLHADSVENRYGDWRSFPATVDANFSLWPNQAQLQWVDVVAGKWHLKAAGALHDFASPRLDVNYTAELDLAQAGEVLRLPELRAGKLELAGNATWTAAAILSHGKFTAHDAAYSTPDFHLYRATVGADYAYGRTTGASGVHEKLTLAHIFASAFGGTAVGDAELVRMPGASASIARAQSKRPVAQMLGTLHLRLNRMSLSQLTAAISTRALPFDRMRFVGLADGSLEASGSGSVRDLIARLDLNVTPPPVAAPEDLPVTATLRGRYLAAAQKLELDALKLATRGTQISATGVMARSSSLQATIVTTDLAEWKPAFTAFGGPRQWPVEVHGRASFSGTVGGTLAAPAIAGAVVVEDFDSLLAPAPVRLLPTKAGAPPVPPQLHRMHWDRMTADLQYTPSLLAVRHATLKHGAAQIDFDFAATLTHGSFLDASPFTLAASVHHADVPDMLAIAGYSYPITGTADLNVRVSGTSVAPQGSGHVIVTNARMYEEPVQRISADVLFANREAQFKNVQVLSNGATITGEGAYNLASTAFRFQARGENVQLARVRQMQTPRLSIGGLLDFTASGSGTEQAPAITARAQLRNLVMNGERVGDLSAVANTAGDMLHLSARSGGEGPRLTAEGDVRLRSDFLANLRFGFNRLDVDPLLRAFLKGRITAHSALVGTATLQGPLRTPQQLAASVNISELSAEMEHIPIRNEGPIRFSVAHESLRIEELRLVGTDTALRAYGAVQLAAPRALDLSADGHLNLRLIQSLNPDIVSYGQMALNVHIGGELARPHVEGQIDVANAAISYLDLPNGLSDINGRLVFDQDRLQIANLTGRTGGGTLNIGGFITYAQGLGFNLNAGGRDIRLRYPPGISSMANADLRLTGNLQNALLSGEVTVTKFGVNPQFDLSTYVARAKQPLEAPNPDSPLAHLRLDVHVVSTPELQVQTSLAKISGDVDLRLRGTGTRPVVLGRLAIIEGDVSFQGTKYRLERGDITFTNPVRIEPVLDIQATTTVRDYDITLGFHGPVDKLSTTYRSDPPLATADIVSLLAFGRTREESNLQTATVNSNLPPETYSILGEALNAAVSSRMQKIFGVSRIKIDPQTGGAENNVAGPTVTIEQQVANKLTITYISNLSRANYQTIQAEYNLNRNVSVVAVRDWTGVVTFDIRIRQRRR